MIGGFKAISYGEERNDSKYIDAAKRVYPYQLSTLVIRLFHHHLITIKNYYFVNVVLRATLMTFLKSTQLKKNLIEYIKIRENNKSIK